MKHTTLLKVLTLFSVLVAFVLVSVAGGQSRRRDYMTDAEIELVREAQDIDARIDVLTRMIDRRFALLNLDVGGAKVSEKETSRWGAAPTGTRTEMLDDIRNLLQKAIDDIDNVAAHPINYEIHKDRTEKQKKKDAERFPNSVRELAASARRYQPALKTLLQTTTDEREKGLILASIEFCEEIIASAKKLSADPKLN